MSEGSTNKPVDPIRKALIVGFLVAGMALLYRFAAPASEAGPSGMLALGFVILTGYTLGELVRVVRLPPVTGYLAGGLLLGPWIAQRLPAAWQIRPFDDGLLSESFIGRLGAVDALAIALIALTAGGALRLGALRDELRTLAGVMGGQVVAVGAAALAFFFAVGGAIPALALPSLAALGPAERTTLASLFAIVVLAGSPVFTVAVTSGAGARGPMTRAILSAVVLTDVLVVALFAIVGVVAAPSLGASTTQGPVGAFLLQHVVGSMAAGVGVGALISLYLRFVRAENLLFLAGTIVGATFLAGRLGLDPLLLFMAAGFVVANASTEGDTLHGAVLRLSMPVYVVFFAMAGAELRLDLLATALPYALALTAIRAAALRLGVGVGARLAHAPAVVSRHAWLGLIAQAGVALTLATLIGDTWGEAGQTVATVIIASIVLNELLGPIALQLGIHLAREQRGAEGPERPTEPVVVEEPLTPPPWAAPAHLPDPWGPPPAVSSKRLLHYTRELEGDLQGLIRDLLQGPLAEVGASASAYLRALRREFLRHHRRARAKVLAAEDPAETALALRREQSELAERWRALVLDRSARLNREQWSPWALVEAVDRIVDALPETLDAPWEPQSYVSGTDESPLLAIQRGALRMRDQWGRLVAQEPPLRAVHVAALARYHLAGLAPPHLEALAAVLVNGETHLARRTRALFEQIVAIYDTVANEAESLYATPERREQLEERMEAARRSVEEAFGLASDECEHRVQEGAQRAAGALGQALRAFKEELPVFGTFDLPDNTRRYSRVFPRRAEAQRVLTAGLTESRNGNAATYASLALELELIGLDGRIKQALDRHGSHLKRMVRGRGPTQIERVQASLAITLDRLGQIFDGDAPGDQMAGQLREVAEPLERVVAEASQAAHQLRAYLADEEAIAPLLDELLREAGRLTDRYTVPTGRMLAGERSLPQAPSTATVPTRELTLAYIESTVSRGLMTLARELAEGTERLERTLDELERVVAFNVELAGAELDILLGERVSSETRALCAEMLLGALGRSRARLDAIQTEAEAWPNQAKDGVREAVLGGLGQFRMQLVDGRVTELRLQLLRERAGSSRLAKGAEAWSSGVRRRIGRIEDAAVAAVGQDRLDRVRDALGVPLPQRRAEPTPDTFSAPGDPGKLPVVYRRLFSDQALEAGDLLTGRQDEIARARRALTGGGPGRGRSVAMIGADGVGKGAVVNAVVRGLPGLKTIRIEPKAPVTLAEVEGWLAELAGGELVLMDGLKWLFSTRPGGFAPLRRWVDGVIATAGRVYWVVSASSSVWSYASAAAPLEDAFPEVIHLRALDPSDLQAAILARHAMSGYQLRFEAEADLGWQLQHLLTRGRDKETRQRDAWFQTLHQATEGVIHDALSYWMASIRKVDANEGVVKVGPVPRPPIGALARLSEDVLLTLGQILRQGWITAALHADLFRTSESTSRAHLTRLTHFGILHENEGTYRVAPHLLTPLRRVLRDRGWLE